MRHRWAGQKDAAGTTVLVCQHCYKLLTFAHDDQSNAVHLIDDIFEPCPAQIKAWKKGAGLGQASLQVTHSKA